MEAKYYSINLKKLEYVVVNFSKFHFAFPSQHMYLFSSLDAYTPKNPHFQFLFFKRWPRLLNGRINTRNYFCVILPFKGITFQ